MRSTLLLSLASSTVAFPIGNILDVLFGGHDGELITGNYPYVPLALASGTGVYSSGTGIPYPTGTSVIPTGTAPAGTGASGLIRQPAATPKPNHPIRALSIKYKLAPTSSAPAAEASLQFELRKREPEFSGRGPTGTGFPTTSSFPTAGPTGTNPSNPFPTASGGVGGFRPSPTTLATLARGPTPTPSSHYTGSEEDGEGLWNKWAEWLGL